MFNPHVLGNKLKWSVGGWLVDGRQVVGSWLVDGQLVDGSGSLANSSRLGCITNTLFITLVK